MTSHRVFRSLLCLLLLFPDALQATPPSLETIMQDPDWIGPPVESAWWQLDTDDVVYQVKQSGTEVRDWYRLAVNNAEPQLLRHEQWPSLDGVDPVVSPDGAWVLSILEGSLMLRDLKTDTLTRLYTGTAPVKRAHFGVGESPLVYFQSDGRWWQVPMAGGASAPLIDLRFEDDPGAPSDDTFKADQLRLSSTLERLRQHDADKQAMLTARGLAAPELGAAPWYLDKKYRVQDSRLSADGRWLLVNVALQSALKDQGEQDKMPHYVTRSGYVEIEDVRRLVGRKGYVAEELWLLDLQTRTRFPINLDHLSGRDVDPLAELKKAQGLTAHGKDSLRPLRISQMIWHPEQATALIQLTATDNKDRWTVRLEAAEQTAEQIHRLTDDAWVSWDNNDLGWVPGTDVAWLLSEADGYAHLYTIDHRGRTHQHTRGEFEFRSVALSPDGQAAYGIANPSHPTEWDVYRVELSSNQLQAVTAFKGVESFALHPEGERILVRHSESYTPIQAAIVRLEDGQVSASTDTRTPAYRELEWQSPQFVAVPSTHGAKKPIWSKFYPAAVGFEGPRPAVLFVHGAGYTQNTHHKFPYYFREQMFHNLLTARGYHVLDMDYRASEGYGRDWRTSIYRQMGTPELEDYIDGVNWLVQNHNADPARVGIYGGSYGGFMTFMAMFKAPEVFAAGASLRPVTDWRHYNHRYTSSILNTPEVDPEAHRRSSPIEFVEGFQGNLLISHGMLDSNVFYKDSVRLAQRLIELGKENWEVASYPLEGHGYVHPESWLDQYRRILKLFETTIGDAAMP